MAAEKPENHQENKTLKDIANETLKREKFSTGSEHGDERLAANLVQYAVEKLAHLEQAKDPQKSRQIIQEKVVGLRSASESQEQKIGKGAEALAAQIEKPNDLPQNLEEPAEYKNTTDISRGLSVHQAHVSNMQQRVAVMGAKFQAAQELVQKANQPEPSFLAMFKYVGSFVMDSPATKKAREVLEKTKAEYEQTQKEFQTYLHGMEARSDRLQKAPDDLQAKAREEYEQQKLALRAGQGKAGRETKERQQEREKLEETRLALQGNRLLLLETGSKLADEKSGSHEAAQALAKQQGTLEERQENLEAGKIALERAIAQMPPGEKRDELVERLRGVSGARQELGKKQENVSGMQGAIEERQQGVLRTEGELNDQERQMVSNIGDAETAITALAETETVLLDRQMELASSESDLDRFFQEKMKIFQTVDLNVAEGVLAVEEQSYRLSTQLNLQAAQVKNMEILGPGLFDSIAAVRLIPGLPVSLREMSQLPGVSHAINGLKVSGNWLSENVFSPVWGATVGNVVKGWGMIFQMVDQYVIANIPGQKGWTMKKRLDAMSEVPVLNFFAGFLESGGEMIKGLGTMIQHPVDTMGGLASILNHPSLLIKGMVRADEWSEWYSTGKPPLGKLLGKNFLDAGVTLIGGGASMKGVQAGRVAFTAARETGSSVSRAAMRATVEGTKTFGKTLSDDIGRAAKVPGKVFEWGNELVRKSQVQKALGEAMKALDDVLKDPNLSPEQRRELGLKAMQDAVNLDSYIGIFDIAKAFGKAKGEKLLAAGLSMDEALELAYAAMKKSGKTVDDLMDVRHTLGSPPKKFNRPKDVPKDLPDASSISRESATQLREAVRSQHGVPVEKILEAISNPAERHLLTEVWKSLDQLLPDSPNLVSNVEKRVVFEYTIGYFQDYREAMRVGGFPAKSPEQIFHLLQENQRRLAHQIANDKHYFTGSDHGVKHLLEGNMKMAESLMDNLGDVMTPAERIQVRQALIDHDMGYTNWELTKKEGMEFFAMSKDHPIYSTAFIESRKKWYVEHFGEQGYKTIRDAVLDHSRAKPVFTGKGKELIEAIVSTVDCLGVTADVKLATFFRNPEVVGELQRIRSVWDKFSDAGKLTPDGIRKVENARARLLKFVDDAPYDAKTKAAFKNAIEKNLQTQTTLFTINTQFGQMIGGMGDVSLTAERKLHVVFSIDQNKALIREIFGDSVGNASFNKALEDFGFPKDMDKSPGKYPELEEKLAALKRGEEVIIETHKGIFEFKKGASQDVFGKQVGEVLSRNRTIDRMFSDLQEVAKNPSATITVKKIQLRYDQLVPYLDKTREIVLHTGEKVRVMELIRRHEELLLRYLQGQQVDLNIFQTEFTRLVDQGLAKIGMQKAA